MPTSVIDSRAHALQRTLCGATVLLMAVAVLYAAWICIQNFSRIGV